MMRENVYAQPVLGPTSMDKLRIELDADNSGIWSVFLHNFLSLLPDRTERLRTTLTTGDLPGARDAVLSLRMSSQMVGADRLAGLAFDLEQSLRLDARHSEPERILPRLATVYLPLIQQCERQTIYLLQKYGQGKL